MNRIGVRYIGYQPNELKRDLLYFDQIAFDTPSYYESFSLIYTLLKATPSSDNEEFKKELEFREKEIEYLVDNGILLPLDAFKALGELTRIESEDQEKEDGQIIYGLKLLFHPNIKKDDLPSQQFLQSIADQFSSWNRIHSPGNSIVINSNSDVTKLLQNHHAYSSDRARLLSSMKMIADKKNVYTPLLETLGKIGDLPTSEQVVTDIILGKFPTPHDDVPWEDILTFKENSESKDKMIRLRKWVRKVCAQEIPRVELEEEIVFLMNEYEHLLHHHKIKFGFSPIRLAFSIPMEILEHLVKLNWSQAATALFGIENRRAELMLAEREFTGSEVAYIIQVQNQFRE